MLLTMHGLDLQKLPSWTGGVAAPMSFIGADGVVDLKNNKVSWICNIYSLDNNKYCVIIL